MGKKKFVPVMLTPFKEDGALDHDGLSRLTEFYLEAGAAGLFANCLSSEMYELTEEERLAVVKRVIAVAGSRVPVVATGTFKGSPEAQVAFIKKLHALGVEAAILITGIMAGPQEPDTVLQENVYRLLDRTPGIPVGFYECPVPYKRVLSAEQLAGFVAYAGGRVIYHKDTSLDLEGIKAKLKAVKDPAFGLYDAYMVHAVESLKAGSAGLSCIQGNYFPELIVWLCDHYDDPAKEKEVSRVQHFLTDNMEVMHAAYPLVAKYFLQKRGLPLSQYTRSGTRQMSPSVKSGIDELFRKYQELWKEIN